MRRCVGLLSCALLTGASQITFAQRSDTKPPERFSFLAIAGVDQTSTGPSQRLRDVFTTARSTSAAFLVANGDITKEGTSAEFRQFQDAASGLSAAHIGVYAVPGMHDVGVGGSGKENFTRAFGKTYQSFDYGGAHFLLLDSTIALHHPGHFDKAEQDWLSKDLKKVRVDSPVFVFLYHSLAYRLPNERLVDNDFELLPILAGHNVVAMFQGGHSQTEVETINGITAVTTSNLDPGAAAYRFNVNQSVVTIERFDPAGNAPGTVVATVPILRKPRSSVLRAGWDDPDVPFLERRRPAVTLEPRAIVDNPDKELAEYRVDDGPWKPLKKDTRDIWKDQFATKGIAVGMHSADVRLDTSANGSYRDELIFEVERAEDEPTRRWAINLDGPIQSSPVLLDKNLVVSSLDGHVYALELAKGKRHWAFPAKGAFLASPIIAGDSVFVGSTERIFYALDGGTGKMRWKHDFDGPVLATAAVASGVVCATAGNAVVGLDVATGNVRWTQVITGIVTSTIATDNKNFYLTDSSRKLYVLDAGSGNPRWTHQFKGATASAPAVSGAYVFVSDGDMRAIGIGDGSEAWFTPAADGEGFGPPVAAGGSVYAATLPGRQGPGGSVVAFDAVSGQMKWTRPLPQAVNGAAPRVAGDGASLAVMGGHGHVAILDTASGKPLWSYELGPGLIFSTPEYDGKSVYTVTMDDDVQTIDGPHAGAPQAK